ncbi:L,D-transpeptidase [Streptomyces uncialis]|uniref:L,D-transpeptidase n=1 Tax=Streptomyces uncialis TaxID=1048205 RepID=UPI000AECE66C|nr:L,D-transpeptidase [Streptomyces uncialis]MCX4659360.1 L,D-transpeptidase [Streptomyces uncialis]
MRRTNSRQATGRGTARRRWGHISGGLILTLAGTLGTAVPAAAPATGQAAGPTAPAPGPVRQGTDEDGPDTARRSESECNLSTGPYQKDVERHLGLVVDGKQSAADCAAIQTFQREHDVVPAQGYAGLYTYRAVMWRQALAEGDAVRGCPDTSGVVVCIDMNRQVLWVEDAGTILFRPVPARTGSPDYPTRSGWFEIYKREKEFWSTLYDGPMPFAQFFDGGQALHASYRNIWEDPGSHGCVNLRYDDGKTLWDVLRLGDAVYVWGRRTGG